MVGIWGKKPYTLCAGSTIIPACVGDWKITT